MRTLGCSRVANSGQDLGAMIRYSTHDRIETIGTGLELNTATNNLHF